jgi:hypothetical protein
MVNKVKYIAISEIDHLIELLNDNKVVETIEILEDMKTNFEDPKVMTVKSYIDDLLKDATGVTVDMIESYFNQSD